MIWPIVYMVVCNLLGEKGTAIQMQYYCRLPTGFRVDQFKNEFYIDWASCKRRLITIQRLANAYTKTKAQTSQYHTINLCRAALHQNPHPCSLHFQTKPQNKIICHQASRRASTEPLKMSVTCWTSSISKGHVSCFAKWYFIEVEMRGEESTSITIPR